jgi:hypothetical protein
MKIDGKEIDYLKLDNVVISGVDLEDFPDFCDAYVESADYEGVELTDVELDELSQDGEFVSMVLHTQLF